MISPTGNKRLKSRSARRSDGFTLIELILVMTLLVVLAAITMPALKGFFRGRELDSEAQRFLSLTHYAQSRAISEGMPMELWIDTDAKSYGSRIMPGYVEYDRKTNEFRLGENLRVTTIASTTRVRSTRSNQSAASARNTIAIRFAPDGSIGDTSPEMVLFSGEEGNVLGIVESQNRLKYEVQDFSKSRK